MEPMVRQGNFEFRSADYADLRRLKKAEKVLPEPEVPGLYRFGDTRNACSHITKIKAFGWKPKR